MITIIVPEWFVWMFIGAMGISIVLQAITLVLKIQIRMITKATKQISDEILEKYGQL